MQSSVHTASVVSVIFVFIICNWTFGMVDLASSDYINEGCIASIYSQHIYMYTIAFVSCVANYKTIKESLSFLLLYSYTAI